MALFIASCAGGPGSPQRGTEIGNPPDSEDASLPLESYHGFFISCPGGSVDYAGAAASCDGANVTWEASARDVSFFGGGNAELFAAQELKRSFPGVDGNPIEVASLGDGWVYAKAAYDHEFDVVFVQKKDLTAVYLWAKTGDLTAAPTVDVKSDDASTTFSFPLAQKSNVPTKGTPTKTPLRFEQDPDCKSILDCPSE